MIPGLSPDARGRRLPGRVARQHRITGRPGATPTRPNLAPGAGSDRMRRAAAIPVPSPETTPIFAIRHVTPVSRFGVNPAALARWAT